MQVRCEMPQIGLQVYTPSSCCRNRATSSSSSRSRSSFALALTRGIEENNLREGLGNPPNQEQGWCTVQACFRVSQLQVSL